MHFQWITDDGVKVIAIVGTSKNAGKTSLLNHLLWQHQKLSFAVFSTGIDGEKEDAVFKTPKPSVQLYSGTIFCCDADALQVLGAKIQVLASISEQGRDLYLARSLHQLQTMITGPAAVKSQIELARQMMSLGAQKVIVDGSLDRKSIALSDQVDAVALVLGASFGNVQELQRELKRLLILKNLPVYSMDASSFDFLEPTHEIKLYDGTLWQSSGFASLSGEGGQLIKKASSIKNLQAIYIPGSITTKNLKTLEQILPSKDATVLVRHPDCLKLDVFQLENLRKSNSLQCLIPFKIKSFVLNSEAVGYQSQDASIFRSELRNTFPNLDLIDIMEVKHAK